MIAFFVVAIRGFSSTPGPQKKGLLHVDTPVPVSYSDNMNRRRFLAILMPLAANLVVLFGVFMAGWNAWQLIFVYWGESLVIALFAMLRFFSSAMQSAFRPRFDYREMAAGLFMSLFFSVFFFGLLGIIGGILMANMYIDPGIAMGYNPFWPGPFSGPDAVPFSFDVFIDSPLSGVAAFFVVQLWSFIRNFLVPRRYRTGNNFSVLAEPVKRIFIMHSAALVGGWFIIFTWHGDTPSAVFIVWIGLKILLDLFSYYRIEDKDKPRRAE